MLRVKLFSNKFFTWSHFKSFLVSIKLLKTDAPKLAMSLFIYRAIKFAVSFCPQSTARKLKPFLQFYPQKIYFLVEVICKLFDHRLSSHDRRSRFHVRSPISIESFEVAVEHCTLTPEYCSASSDSAVTYLLSFYSISDILSQISGELVCRWTKMHLKFAWFWCNSFFFC